MTPCQSVMTISLMSSEKLVKNSITDLSKATEELFHFYFFNIKNSPLIPAGYLSKNQRDKVLVSKNEMGCCLIVFQNAPLFAKERFG
jgi:hypothetical protein